MTKRLVAMLTVVLVLAGCGLSIPRPTVQLLTLDPAKVPSLGRSDACFPDTGEGPLTADPTYGTAMTVMRQEIIGDLAAPHPRIPVAWLPGFTGRWVGSEVEVLDPQGHVITMTGHTYLIAGNGVSADYWPGLQAPRVWFACTPRPVGPPLP